MESRVGRKRIRGTGNERPEDQKRSKRSMDQKIKNSKIKENKGGSEDQKTRSKDQRRSKRISGSKIIGSSSKGIKIRGSEDREMK